jgi:hypothetical protein
MSGAEDFEHEDVEGPAYERATKAYEAAIAAQTKAAGKAKIKKDRAFHDAAYSAALAQMEREHGRASDEALAALFFLARFRDALGDWLSMLERERERFGHTSADAAGTLAWAADALPLSEPRTRALYRWSVAMSRAATGRPGTALRFVDAAVVEGWSPLLAAETCALVAELARKTPRAELSGVAEDLAERLEDEPSWVTAFDFLGRSADAAHLLETLAQAADDDDHAGALAKAAKKRRAMKPKSAAAKGHPLPHAHKLLADDAPFACLAALGLLESLPPAPDLLRAPAEQLRLELAAATTAGEAAIDVEVTADSDPRPATHASRWAAALHAFGLVLRGRAHEGAPLVQGDSARLTSSEDAFSWEVFHACAAALGRFEVLDAWLDELAAEMGRAALPPAHELRLKGSPKRPAPDARAALAQELYGIELPGDAHALFEAARALNPEEPLSAFDPLEIALVGPFEVLAGLLDERRPRHSMLLHHRYSYHPPEYLPLVSTAEDGLTFGYWLDDWSAPALKRRFLVWSESWEPVGRTAADAVRFELERLHASFVEEYEEASASQRKALDRSSAELAPFFERARAALVSAGASNDGRVAGSYIESLRSGPAAVRALVSVGATRDFLVGFGAEPGAIKPVVALGDPPDAEIAKLGERALSSGDGWTALVAGGRLWRHGGEKHGGTAFRLLDGAYGLLGREGVQRVLRTHHAERWLPNVDLLRDLAGGDGALQ